MADGELIAPIGYSTGWLVLGIALVAVVLVWIVLLALVRGSRRGRGAPPGATADESLKAGYFARIDAIDSDFSAGKISAREAHLRLSAVVRGFGKDVSGVNAPVMTLTELQGTALPDITTAVAEYYPAAFERPERDRIASAVDRARQVISSWR